MESFLGALQSHEYELSPLDIVPSHLYISNVFFYENVFPKATDRVFMPDSVIKAALYDALQSFPILVGYLRRNGLNTMKISIDETNPNLPVWESYDLGVHFSHIKKGNLHRDLWPDGINVTDPLAHPDPNSSLKLVRLRVCRFAENSGVALVVRISHSVFDAKGCTTFINYWAACCCQRLDPSCNAVAALAEPIHDRAVMYRHFPASIRPTDLSWFLWPLSLLMVAFLSLMGWISGKRTATGAAESHLFSIRRESLDKLRSVSSNGQRVSDNDIITALFTMGYAQTKQLRTGTPSLVGKASGLRRPTNVSAIVPCDLRHRLGVPESYTGSCATGLYVTAPSDLLLSPITAISLAEVAAISRKTVHEVDLKTVEQFTKRAMQAIRLVGDKARIVYSLMICQAFSNQSRLPFYQADFGFGTPVLVVPMAYSKSVGVVVSPPPPSKDVHVFLTLEIRDMTMLLQNQEFMSIVNILY